MKLEFTVERQRMSVTQGEVRVLLNGKWVTNFGDRIELIEPGQKYYGDLIGNWASIKPDAAFIKGVLFHPFEEHYRFRDRIRKILEAEEEKEIEEAKRL